MGEIDYWRLCDELSVTQAVLLIIGEDPGKEVCAAEDWQIHERPANYEATKTAMRNAILRGTLPAAIRRTAWERGWDEDLEEGYHLAKGIDEVSVVDDASDVAKNRASLIRRGIVYRAEPDWTLTTVKVDDLKKWLSSRNFRVEFFFPNSSDAPDYLDPDNPRYAPKLAAAIRAWQGVTETNGKSPKQALEKWLREHAAEFSLSDEEGKPNETGIAETAKVANWQPGGGAPKTPVG